MNLTAVGEAIVLRALGDESEGGLFDPYSSLVTGIYKDLAPPHLQSQYPYVVFNLIAAGNQDGFEIAVRRFVVRFSIFTQEGQEAEEGALAGGPLRSAIVDRLLGDWLDAEGREPTFGFDRHALDLDSEWNADAMIYTDTSEQTDGKICQTILEFEFYLSRSAVSPS